MSGIYGSGLHDIRAALRSTQPTEDVYSVERVHGTGYSPIHGLAMEQSIPHVVI